MVLGVDLDGKHFHWFGDSFAPGVLFILLCTKLPFSKLLSSVAAAKIASTPPVLVTLVELFHAPSEEVNLSIDKMSRKENVCKKARRARKPLPRLVLPF